MTYKFDPIKYGFVDIKGFKNLAEFFGGHENYIKVTNIHNEHFWYTAIKFSTIDKRVSIYQGAYIVDKQITSRDYPRNVYLGMISSNEFAESLLKHLMCTLDQDSVDTIGCDRLNMKSILGEINEA